MSVTVSSAAPVAGRDTIATYRPGKPDASGPLLRRLFAALDRGGSRVFAAGVALGGLSAGMLALALGVA